MTTSHSTTPMAPPWLDRSLFPFTSRWFESAEGRMHYLDEGRGAPLVLVHGTPTWSFLYRHLITRLSTSYRVIAVDHLGFGLSDKPLGASYRPGDHARRLTAFLDALDVPGITLVAHDFGGPIGMATALARPERIDRLVLFNTWVWSLHGDPRIARGARVAGSSLGRLLYRYLNFPVTVLMPSVVADRGVLTPGVRRHYAGPLRTPDSRMGAWALARALLDDGQWYERLWAQRGRLRDKPMLLVWGMKDPTFGSSYLERWKREFPDAMSYEIADCGHFVPEEAPDAAGQAIERFLDATARHAPA